MGPNERIGVEGVHPETLGGAGFSDMGKSTIPVGVTLLDKQTPIILQNVNEKGETVP